MTYKKYSYSTETNRGRSDCEVGREWVRGEKKGEREKEVTTCRREKSVVYGGIFEGWV